MFSGGIETIGWPEMGKFMFNDKENLFKEYLKIAIRFRSFNFQVL